MQNDIIGLIGNGTKKVFFMQARISQKRQCIIRMGGKNHFVKDFFDPASWCHRHLSILASHGRNGRV